MTPPARVKRPHKAVRIRRSDLARSQRMKVAFALFRFSLYGFVGLSSEIIFYNLVRLCSRVPGLSLLFRFEWRVDERLGLDRIWDTPAVAAFGQCSLWMFPVYALASFGFIEPLYRHLLRYPVALRAAAYGSAILLWEGVSGRLLQAFTGYEIWRYADAGAVLWGMTSLYILPIWMITGLLVELIYRELMDPDLLKALESPLPRTPEETEASLQLMR
jgi:hypothetical protein